MGGQAGVGCLLCYTGTVGFVDSLEMDAYILANDAVTPSLLFLAFFTLLLAWSAHPVVTIYIWSASTGEQVTVIFSRFFLSSAVSIRRESTERRVGK